MNIFQGLGKPALHFFKSGVGEVRNDCDQVGKIMRQPRRQEVDDFLTLGQLYTVTDLNPLTLDLVACGHVPIDADDFSIGHLGQAELLLKRSAVRSESLRLPAPVPLIPKGGKGLRRQLGRYLT